MFRIRCFREQERETPCIGAFLTALLKGRSLKRSVQLAAAAGASCVAAYDALSGLKSFEELEQRIEAGWKKN